MIEQLRDDFIYLQFIFLATLFAFNPNIYTVYGIGFSLLLLTIGHIGDVLLSMKDMEIKKEQDKSFHNFNMRIDKIRAELLANSEYMAKELGTIKNAMQIKQMGRG